MTLSKKLIGPPIERGWTGRAFVEVGYADLPIAAQRVGLPFNEVTKGS